MTLVVLTLAVAVVACVAMCDSFRRPPVRHLGATWLFLCGACFPATVFLGRLDLPLAAFLLAAAAVMFLAAAIWHGTLER